MRLQRVKRQHHRRDADGVALVRAHGQPEELDGLALGAEAVEDALGQMLDAARRELRRAAAAVRGAGKNDDLVLHIEAAQVGGGVGFGVAEFLRLAQRGTEVRALAVHLVDDEVRRAVHDAVHGVDLVRPRERQRLRDAGDRAAAGRLVAQADALALRQLHQLAEAEAQRRLVRGDDVLARFQRAFHILVGRVRAREHVAHQLDVGVA